MNESYDRAMSAPIKAPLDEEVAFADWPLPEPRAWEPRDESLMGRAARMVDDTWEFLRAGWW